MKISETILVPVDSILPSELNPRRHSALQLKPESLEELGASMQAQGQQEVITVRRCDLAIGMFELVNGERRWRAARAKGITHLRAEVREMSDAEVRRMMMVTGTQGEQLSPLAQAHGYDEMMKAEALAPATLAKELGVDYKHVLRRLLLLELPPFIAAAVDAGTLPVSVAEVIAGVPGEQARTEFAKLVLNPVMQVEPLGVRAAEELRRTKFSVTLRGAPFKTEDTDLVRRAGACSDCPWRAGNNPDMYGTFPARSPLADTCMRVECFAEKKMAAQHRVAEEYRAKGMEPLDDDENLRAFPEGEDGLSYKVDLVEWSKPVPIELLKKEVAAVSDLVKWEDLMHGGATQVVRRVGFDQSGKAVVLVRVGEAVCAADKNEQAIFNDETRLRYGLEKTSTIRMPKPVVVAPSLEATPTPLGKTDSDLPALPVAVVEPKPALPSQLIFGDSSHALARALLALPDMRVAHYDPSFVDACDEESDYTLADVSVAVTDPTEGHAPDEIEAMRENGLHVEKFVMLCGEHDSEYDRTENQ
jgi:ParB/RepB/Spo0J family partition protein